MNRSTKKAVFGLFIMFLINNQGFAQLEDALRLTLSSGSYSDETVVRFLEVATDSFDTDWDAYKLSNSGNTPNFYTVVNQESYTINALHKPFTDKTIPLHLEVAFSGTYTITAEEIGPFDSLCSITLIDKVLNSTQDLRMDSSYTFDFVMGDPSDRFLVEFTMGGTANELQPSVTSLGTQSLENSILIFNMDKKIVIDFKDITADASIGIYDLSGREIYEAESIQVSSSNSIWEFSSESSNVYIVKVTAGNKFYSQKVYLSN